MRWSSKFLFQRMHDLQMQAIHDGLHRPEVQRRYDYEREMLLTIANWTPRQMRIRIKTNPEIQAIKMEMNLAQQGL